MSGAKLRVAITDDEAPARNRIRNLLEDVSEMLPIELVGEAENGRKLLELRPDDVALAGGVLQDDRWTVRHRLTGRVDRAGDARKALLERTLGSDAPQVHDDARGAQVPRDRDLLAQVRDGFCPQVPVG